MLFVRFGNLLLVFLDFIFKRVKFNLNKFEIFKSCLFIINVNFNIFGVLNWIEKRLEFIDIGCLRYVKIWGDLRMFFLNFDFILVLFFFFFISFILIIVWF